MHPETPVDTASVKEMYDALRSNLKELYALFFETYLKVTGSYTLIIGWLITSNEARNYIAGNRVVYFAVLITLVGLSALYLVLCKRMWHKSRRIMTDLGDLCYMKQKFYGNYLISRHSYLIIVSGYLFITAVLCIIFTNVFLPNPFGVN